MDRKVMIGWSLMVVGALVAGGSVSNAHAVQYGTAWTQTDVWQDQSFVATEPSSVILKQRNEVEQGIQFGDQAETHVHQKASQVEFSDGATMGHQNQFNCAGSNIKWEKNKWPAWTEATTCGLITQEQSMWSHEPIYQQEKASMWQKSRVGDTVSAIDAVAKQENDGVVGDAVEKQRLKGSTHAEGYTSPPFPKKHEFDFGGKLRQFIELKVENILNW